MRKCTCSRFGFWTAMVVALSTNVVVVLADETPTTQPSTRPSETELRGYGEPIILAADTHVDIAEVLADPKAYDGEEVTVAGTIAAVCPKRGCWVKLAPASTEVSNRPDMKSVFVKLNCDESGHLVPTDAVGKTAYTRGTIHIEEMDEATARHMAEDAGATPEEIEAIKGPQATVSMATTGVLVEA